MTRHVAVFEVEITLADLDPGALELLRTSLEEAAQRLARQGVAVRCRDIRTTVERGCVGVFQALDVDSVTRLLVVANVPVRGARIHRATMQRLDGLQT